eukprot:jgi/Mesvir1/19817/Mv13107-RA.1
MDQLTELKVDVERSQLTGQLEKVEAERKKTAMDLRLCEQEFQAKALANEARIREAMESYGKILHISDRDRLFMQDRVVACRSITFLFTRGVNDLLYIKLDDRGGSAAPRKTLEISAVAREMGYNVKSDDLVKIGKVMASKWRKRFPGQAIPTYEKNVNGLVRLVKWYEDVPENREMMEESIREVMGESSSRPMKQRRLC